jgi:hypothetical protein
MPTPREMLAAYSNQQATTEQVWRALTEHSGWYVPAAFGVQRLHTTSGKGATIFANELPTADRALILFTDAVAAARADGAPIGTFMHEFSAVQIFQSLDENYGCVRVNPHSPKSEGWYISQEAFPLARLWAQVVGLEQAIANAPGDTIPYAELAGHPGFMVLINSQHLPVTLNLKESEGSYAVVFTSPDRYQAFVAMQPAEHQANLKSATLDGKTLCKQLQSFDIAGILLYYRDTTGMVLRKEEFDRVIAA